MESISLAIPTYCRPGWLAECFSAVKDDPRIREIVISDDCSSDGSFDLLVSQFSALQKVRLYRNKSNLDCYRNKRQAVELATSEWVILFDDDNVLGKDYLDAIYRLPSWDPKTIYCPDFAKPFFNYMRFAGHTVDRTNVARFLNLPKVRGLPEFDTTLNTANYFLHRQSFLEAWSGSIDPVTADTIFHAYNWLNRGGKFFVVPNMRYIHRVHDGSHYKNNRKRTGNLAARIIQKLKALR